MATRTASVQRGRRRSGRAPSDGLILALDCARPLEAPVRIPLAGIDEVRFERRDDRAIERQGELLVVGLADDTVSARHATLRRSPDGWVVRDEGSKNGTFVDGQRVEEAGFGAESLLEIGGAFFLVRPGIDATPLADRPPGMRTLSEPLRAAFELIARVAPSQVPVLLTGETGTGKELVARAVHTLSRRAGPFVALNCAAVPEALLASELFGARKGAFTGASVNRPGMVASAHGGTLFLDEVAELTESAQAALLRVLQEREVVPLGATQAVRVDIRVVAATHESLTDRVSARRFRKDLYARLRGFTLRLPPLRERREDVGLLIAELLPRVAPERAREIRLQRAAARGLFCHDWPLNVRELEHALATAVAISGDAEIELEHLPEELRAAVAGEPEDDLAARERFAAAAHDHGGNVSEIARALATSRTQVRRLASRFGLDLERLRR